MDLWQINAIPGESLGAGSGVAIRVESDSDHLAWHMAREMVELIRTNNDDGRKTCLILSVSPIAPLQRFAQLIVEQSVDCTGTTIIHTNDFVDETNAWIPLGHPFSYRAFMGREFYERLPLGNVIRPENRVFPCPDRPQLVDEIIADRGGVDGCFAGVGLNGHLGYNEPEDVATEVFARSASRVVALAPESRAHLAIALGCSLGLVPERAVTVGMGAMLGARRLRIYANRSWQAGVVREALHGPVSSRCPLSLIRGHSDAVLTISRSVAEPRNLKLHSS